MNYQKLLPWLLFCALFTVMSFPAYAEVSHRGFNTYVNSTIETLAPELDEQWGVNLVRLGVGDFDAQDDVTSLEEYWEFMNPLLDRAEEVMPLLCDRGIKVVFALLSPPGGFHSKGENGGTPQHKIFEDAQMQEDFKEVWATLSERLKDHDGCIHAYDILNEPAQASVADGLKDWSELSLDLIDIIRENDSETGIMVKPLYANPVHLRKLPDFQDTGVIVSVHIYPNIKYVHQGLHGAPVGLKAPKNKPMIRRSLLPIALYMLQQQNKVNRGVIPAVPKLNIGEFAVARWAPGASDYMDRLLKFIEGDLKRGRFFNKKWVAVGKKPARIPGRLSPRQRKVRRSLNQLGFDSWTYHAIGEATVWDPRYSDDQEDTTTVVSPPEYTNRGEVLKEYFQRNME